MENNLENFDPTIIMEKIQCKMPFYNEYQFQFEFAISVKEYFKESNNIEIVFEQYYPTTILSGNEEISKKNYTDIVIYDTEGNYIAIELKYNLKDGNRETNKRYLYNNGEYEISIAKKGATDNCRYDFLYDIYRLEQLKVNGKYENKSIKKFLKGFSIIISNDKAVWEYSSPHKNNAQNTTLKISKNFDQNFCIGNGSQTMTDCKWMGGKNCTAPKPTRPAFTLKNSYTCNWSDKYYFEDKKANDPSPGFKYLIITVK